VKLRISLEKTKLNSKTKPEKVTQLESDIVEAEAKVVSSKKEFEEVSKVIKVELDRFDHEKVDDMQAAMQGFLESMIENQKEVGRVTPS
jgi:sorting nexin-1/2